MKYLKNKLRKGFTLIELLAVIVILAVIALIATPRIMAAIEQARKEAFRNDVYGVVKAAERDYVKRLLDEEKVFVTYEFEDYVQTVNPSHVDDLNFTGSGPKNGVITVDEGGNIQFALHDDNWCGKLDENGEVILEDLSESSCEVGASSYTWINRYDLNSYTYLSNALKGDENNYAVFGTTFDGSGDAVFMNVSRSGELIWSKTLGGSNTESILDSAKTNDGHFYAVGQSDSNDGDLSGLNNGQQDAIIIKYDSDGEPVWIRNFGGSENDMFYSVKATPDGGAIVSGEASSSDGDMTGLNIGQSAAILVKYDSDGEIEWSTSFGGSFQDLFNSVTVTSAGNFVAVGYSTSSDGDLSDINVSFLKGIVVKFDSSGNVIWKNAFGDPDGSGVFNSVSESSDGGIIVSGRADLPNSDNRGSFSDAVTVKYNSLGEVEWYTVFGGSDSDVLFSVKQTSDGGYIASGYSYSNDQDMEGISNDDSLGLVIKYDSTGNIEWFRTFGGTDWEELRSISLSHSDGFIIVGESWSDDGDFEEFYGDGSLVIKIDSQGDF